MVQKDEGTTKRAGVEGALERKRGDGASLPISKKREDAVDKRNRGMSSRIRTCSTSLDARTDAISIRKSVPSFLLLLALQDG